MAASTASGQLAPSVDGAVVQEAEMAYAVTVEDAGTAEVGSEILGSDQSLVATDTSNPLDGDYELVRPSTIDVPTTIATGTEKETPLRRRRKKRPLAPFQKLPNEVLTSIIVNLDPPSAVCLGVSCKYFYGVVPDACQNPFKKLCPKFRSEDGRPSLLRPYHPTAAEALTRQYAKTAIRLVHNIKEGDRDWSQSLLSEEYIALMDRMYWGDFFERDGYRDLEEWEVCQIRRGHLFYPKHISSFCSICTVIRFMKASQHVVKHGAGGGDGFTPDDFRYVEDEAGIEYYGEESDPTVHE